VRRIEMGEAPGATGGFGRTDAGSRLPDKNAGAEGSVRRHVFLTFPARGGPETDSPLVNPQAA